jgi:hypothetical protein
MVISISGGWGGGSRRKLRRQNSLKTKKCEGCAPLGTSCKTDDRSDKVWRIIIMSRALLVIPCAFLREDFYSIYCGYKDTVLRLGVQNEVYMCVYIYILYNRTILT